MRLPTGFAPVLAAISGLLSVCAPCNAEQTDDQIRFRSHSIALEVRAEAVAAYQVELTVKSGQAQIVGIEGGDARGFAEPPYYDPAALFGGRIVLAALCPAHPLPPGRHTVARVHMQEIGSPPVYELRVITAGNSASRPMKVTAILIDDRERSPEETP